MKKLVDEWERLREALDHHDHLYFNLQTPTLSDGAYDALKRRFTWLSHRLGREVPKVGAPIDQDSLLQVPHEKPMLSIESEVGEEALKAFLRRVGERLGEENIYPLAAQHKVDGLALSLKYSDGKLVYAATRGNGRVGEDVTHNARALVPSSIDGKISDACVRGEVYIPTSVFFNQSNQKYGFTTPRNAASGIMRKLQMREGEMEMLRFVAYELVGADSALSYTETLKLLQEVGFQTLSTTLCFSEKECISHYKSQDRALLDYEIDGLVYKLNRLDLWERAGYTSRAPRATFACKFPAREVVSKVEKILFQVGRTGVITPVAQVTPVNLGGVRVSSATLHNVKILRDRDVRIGDQVVLSRAGDVIPQVQQVLYELREEGEATQIPATCPSCEKRLVVEDCFVRCPGGWSCSEQSIARIIHFVKCMEIDDLSKAHITRFYQLGLVRTIEDLYRLEEKHIVSLKGWGERSWRKVKNRLTRPAALQNLIFALGIEGVGRVTAASLATKYSSWDTFLKVDLQGLREVEGVGDKTAANIHTFVQNNLKQLERLGEMVKVVEMGVVGKKERWAITGTFFLPRKEISKSLEARGIEVAASLSSSVACLLCGKAPGSKLEEAKRLKIRIMYEKELRELLDPHTSYQSTSLPS